MLPSIRNFVEKELFPKAAPYLPELRARAGFILIGLIVGDVAHRTFTKFNVNATYREFFSPLIAIGTSAGISVALMVLRPLSNEGLAWILLVYTVYSVALPALNKNANKNENPSPPIQSPSPAPEPPSHPPKCLQLLYADSSFTAPLRFPPSIENLFSQILPGKWVSFNSADGWDLNFFVWVIAQSSCLKGYNIYHFSGTTQEDTNNLEEYIAANPKSVVIVTSHIDAEIKVPLESYFIGYFSLSPYSDDHPCSLITLTKDETVNLFEAWVQSREFLCNHDVRFEGDSIKLLYEFAQRDKSLSLYSWIRKFLFLRTEFGVTTTTSAHPQLVMYPREEEVRVTRNIITQILSLKKDYGLDIVYCPANKEMEMPSFLMRIKKGELNETRRVQSEQIVEALGGEDAPHAIVVGTHSIELERILSLPNIQASNVLQFDPGEVAVDLLLDYLWLNPKTILVTRSPLSVDKELLRLLPPETSVLGLMKNQPNIHPQDSHFNSPLLENFKQVRLTPLNQKQCKADIESWAVKKYKFEDQVVLEIAVAAAFLLHEENGSEFMFVKDMIERAGKKEGVISAQDIWRVFITLYDLHVEQKKEEEKLLPHSPNPQKCKPLISVALTLKKKYGVVLPVKEVKLSEPPAFLTDLNEEVKNLNEFVLLEDRLEKLEDALIGQYANALLIGASGVGKTTLVKLAAWMSANNKFKAEHPLAGKTIYSLNMNILMSGKTMYIGVLDTKISQLFNFLIQAKNAVLFIDEVHLIMGAGATRGNEMGTISQQIKTYLENSEVSVIGATTKDEYDKWVQQDGAFIRRFNPPLDLGEPSDKDMFDIFKNYSCSSKFKRINSQLRISDEDINAVLEVIKQDSSNISKVDKGKKLLEQIAKSAKRNKKDKVSE